MARGKKAPKGEIKAHARFVNSLPDSEVKDYAKTLKLGSEELHRLQTFHANGKLEKDPGFSTYLEDRAAKSRLTDAEKRAEVNRWRRDTGLQSSSTRIEIKAQAEARAYRELTSGGYRDSDGVIRLADGSTLDESVGILEDRVRQIKEVMPWENVEGKEFKELSALLNEAEERKEFLSLIEERFGKDAVRTAQKDYRTSKSIDSYLNRLLSQADRSGPLSAAMPDAKNPLQIDPEFLSEEQIRSIYGQPGNEVRSTTIYGSDKSSLPFMQDQVRWNDAIEKLAEHKLNRGDFGSNGPSEIRAMGGYEPVDNKVGDYLSKRDAWIAERNLQYGHIGSASNPAFFYAMNDPSNASPQSLMINQTTSASMTPAEYQIASDRMVEQGGYRWTPEDMARFESHVDELNQLSPNALRAAGLDQATIDNLRALGQSQISIDDPMRAMVETEGAKYGSRGRAPYLLSDARNRFLMDRETRGWPSQEQAAAMSRRLAYLSSMPKVDINAVQTQGRMERFPGIGGEKELARIGEELKNTDPKVLQEYKDNVNNLINNKPGITVDQALREAARRMGGRIPATLIGLLGSVSVALANSPDDETKVDAVFRGLDWYDKNVIQHGRDAVMGAADAVGVGGVLRAADDRVQADFEKVPDGWSKWIAQFLYGAVKDAPAELASIPASIWHVMTNTQEVDNPRQTTGLPQNVVAVQPEPEPYLRYGGVLQNIYP